ncbi:hypothetical protein JOC36_000876 [Weissella uvarum]|uniref:hypothetical protein n=1 Tax=Weissella uvarum TaxID=1479233 RepID=UPI001EF8AA46|nr:hypothetical protein [Weissella uvarum]MBM7617327.1 hypothetical protein [Weissella uvarum]
MAETITNESFQYLLDDLMKGGPVVGEKKFDIEDFFQLQDPDGQTHTYSHIDILKRADDTYWMPLDEDRHTLTNITNYQIYVNKTNNWASIADWFSTEDI